MALGNFSATVDEWCRKSERRMLAVARESTQRTVAIAQSRIQVDTGFARASVKASLESMPQIDPVKNKPAGGSFPYDPGDITLTIANMQLGQTCWIGWTANYVGFLNRGTSKMAGSGFVDLAALQWQHTVSEVVAEAKARVG